MNLGELYESKIFQKRGMSFDKPEAYVGPFVNALQKENIWDGGVNVDIEVENPVTNINFDGSVNTSYPRLKVQKNFIETEVGPGVFGVVGIVVGLDIQSPVIKVYAGYQASACTNLYVFNADYMAERSVFSPNLESVYNEAAMFGSRVAQEHEDMVDAYVHLSTTPLNFKERKEMFGKFLFAASEKGSKLSTGIILNAAKQLQDMDSDYYVNNSEECSMLNVYDALTYSNTRTTGILHRHTKALEFYKAMLN